MTMNAEHLRFSDLPEVKFKVQKTFKRGIRLIENILSNSVKTIISLLFLKMSVQIICLSVFKIFTFFP